MGASSAGNFGNTKGSYEHTRSNKDSHLHGKPGQVKRNGYK